MIKNKIVIIAPHPDDETLGCGGTILRHVEMGDEVHWVIVTGMSEKCGFAPEKIAARKIEIEKVGSLLGIEKIHEMGYPPARLDSVAKSELVEKAGEIFAKVEPNIIFAPYWGDIHSDHEIVFDMFASCTKWFRYPFVKKILAYETLSETELSLKPESKFQPNCFVDISGHLERKLSILAIYKSELGQFPFPRSSESVKALAAFRGTTVGCQAAEAFMIIKELI